MKNLVLSLFFLALVVHSKGSEIQNDLKENEEFTTPKEGMTTEIESSDSTKRSGPVQFGYNTLMQSYALAIKQRLKQFKGKVAVKRTSNLLNKLISNWDVQILRHRKKRTVALTAAKENIDALYNAETKPTASFVAVLKLIDTLYKVTSKTGAIVHKPGLFLCSVINLFGEVRSWRFIQNILFPKGYYQELSLLTMGRRADRVLAQKSNSKLRGIKQYINGKGKTYDKMHPEDVPNLRTEANKIVNSIGFSGYLEGKITGVAKANSPVDAKLGFNLVDLYVKFQMLRQLLLIGAKAIIPSQKSITFYDQSIQQIQDKDKSVLRFLYDPDVNSTLMPYFDGQDYPIINTYMSIMLNITRPDKFPGLNCIGTDRKPRASAWNTITYPGKSNPIFGWDNTMTSACKWRIISHAQNLYSIAYKDGGPNCSLCGSVLTIDGRKCSNRTLVGLDLIKPVLWEIGKTSNNQNNFKIQAKRFCGANCNDYLSRLNCRPVISTEGRSYSRDQYVGRLISNNQPNIIGTHYWKISQATPSSDSVSSSADLGQSSGESGDTSVDEVENGIHELTTTFKKNMDKNDSNKVRKFEDFEV